MRHSFHWVQELTLGNLFGYPFSRPFGWTRLTLWDSFLPKVPTHSVRHSVTFRFGKLCLPTVSLCETFLVSNLSVTSRFTLWDLSVVSLCETFSNLSVTSRLTLWDLSVLWLNSLYLNSVQAFNSPEWDECLRVNIVYPIQLKKLRSMLKKSRNSKLIIEKAK